MIKTHEKELCSGCGTCALVCPQKCITYSNDYLGNPFAVVDTSVCIGCGACEKVCPIQKTFNQNSIGITAYAAYARDDKVRYRGSSGGMFETIAEWILSLKGSVFASRFDENLRLRMFEASTEDEVKQLTKSKYLQSDVSKSFPTIRDRIRSGMIVLVCSTPCHIAALKNYLGKDAESDKLFLMDFFCHGVPSQELFDRCKAYVEKRDGIEITGFEFRSKIRNGATPHYYSVKYVKNGKEKLKTGLYLDDPFYLGFQKYITLRDSCYHCPYGSGNHSGDITVGDFHEIEKYVKGINRFDGVSTVIINSEKGRRLWSAVSNHMVIHEMDIQKLYSDHTIYCGGTSEPASRNEFINDAEKLPFDMLIKKWLNSKQEWKKKLYYHLPIALRKMLKSLTGI
jgi:coenzyme F420-reducing hydrogenase beta subunit